MLGANGSADSRQSDSGPAYYRSLDLVRTKHLLKVGHHGSVRGAVPAFVKSGNVLPWRI